MDAVAKRAFWKIVQDITPGRSLLLTTHSMEEADALATRAAIISRRLLAVGTTKELRDRYAHVHYVSILLSSAPASTQEEMTHLRDWILGTVPGAKMERDIMGGQIRFTIPGAVENQRNNPVASLIDMLEREKERKGIEYYSIGGATLENVFLNVVRDNNVEEEDGNGEGSFLKRWIHW